MKSKSLIVFFSWLNATAVPLFIICFAIALLNDSDFLKHPPRSFLEYLIMVLIFHFVLVMPCTATAALILNRKVRLYPAFWINGIVLSFWVLIAGSAIFALIFK